MDNDVLHVWRSYDQLYAYLIRVKSYFSKEKNGIMYV